MSFVIGGGPTGGCTVTKTTVEWQAPVLSQSWTQSSTVPTKPVAGVNVMQLFTAKLVVPLTAGAQRAMPMLPPVNWPGSGQIGPVSVSKGVVM